MKKVKITQVKSGIDRSERQKQTLIALGLKKLNASREVEATPQILGMINKVTHLVKVEEVAQSQTCISTLLIKARGDTPKVKINKMKLHNLKPAEGSVHKAIRIGRGEASGKGGTSTKGNKGGQSRAGYKSKMAHEGGQMPIQ